MIFIEKALLDDRHCEQDFIILEDRENLITLMFNSLKAKDTFKSNYQIDRFNSPVFDRGGINVNLLISDEDLKSYFCLQLLNRQNRECPIDQIKK
jgi:hypothetical protein